MTNNEIYLFEHKPFKPLPEGLNGDVLKEFKHFLNNVWQKYKSGNSFKQYLWLFYIICTHPVMLLKKLKGV